MSDIYPTSENLLHQHLRHDHPDNHDFKVSTNWVLDCKTPCSFSLAWNPASFQGSQYFSDFFCLLQSHGITLSKQTASLRKTIAWRLSLIPWQQPEPMRARSLYSLAYRQPSRCIPFDRGHYGRFLACCGQVAVSLIPLKSPPSVVYSDAVIQTCRECHRKEG